MQKGNHTIFIFKTGILIIYIYIYILIKTIKNIFTDLEKENLTSGLKCQNSTINNF